jgi:hypothetical protein
VCHWHNATQTRGAVQTRVDVKLPLDGRAVICTGVIFVLQISVSGG